MKNQRGIAHVAAVVVIVAISLSMIGVIYYFKSEYCGLCDDTSGTIVGINTNAVVNTNSTVATNSTVDGTEGWLTYTNSTHEYTIKYPRDYSPSGTDKSYQFQRGNLAGDDTYIVTVNVHTAPIEGGQPGQDIYTWGKNGFPTDADVEKFHSNPRLHVINDQLFMATDGDTGSAGNPEYLIFHNNKLYVLTDFRSGDESNDTNFSIISTLQFIDLWDKDDWQTYTNTTNNFSILIPSDWTINEFDDSENVTFISPSTLAEREQVNLACNDDDITTKCQADGVPSNLIFSPSLGAVIEGSEQEVTYNGNKFIKYEAVGLYGETHYKLESGGTIYDFSAIGQSELVRQILSTFQFTEN